LELEVHQLDTPVALFIFNRPKTTARVLDAIRQARPKRLLVVADGPRADREGEADQCRQARDLMRTVDWPCEIETNFSDINLGCGRRMSSGISWVFDRVPEAILLEDDCLPVPGFFRFCAELLERYRDDSKIGLISGDCFLPAELKCPNSYYFSRYPHIWGWASWRRAWKLYDYEMASLSEKTQGDFLERFDRRAVGKHFYDLCQDVKAGEIDTWDFQMVYSFRTNSLLAIVPSRTLVSNIGFGPDATHTTDSASALSNLPAYEPDYPLCHPQTVAPWQRADRYTEDAIFGIPLVVEKPEMSE
jgi:hypothetical protein